MVFAEGDTYANWSGWSFLTKKKKGYYQQYCVSLWLIAIVVAIGFGHWWVVSANGAAVAGTVHFAVEQLNGAFVERTTTTASISTLLFLLLLLLPASHADPKSHVAMRRQLYQTTHSHIRLTLLFLHPYGFPNVYLIFLFIYSVWYLFLPLLLLLGLLLRAHAVLVSAHTRARLYLFSNVYIIAGTESVANTRTILTNTSLAHTHTHTPHAHTWRYDVVDAFFPTKPIRLMCFLLFGESIKVI